MLKWMREHWKLLTAILLGLVVGLIVVGLILAFPPVAAALVPLAVALPVVGPAIAAMAPVAAAFTIGALVTAATWTASTVWNIGVRITNWLDGLIRPKKPGPGGDSGARFDLLDEDSDNEGIFSSDVLPRSSYRKVHESGLLPSSSKDKEPLLVDIDEVPTHSSPLLSQPKAIHGASSSTVLLVKEESSEDSLGNGL
ncbi:hypothetical protein [Legionella spiritensis]|uniref:hypothetical protein n=1 Tax=Legionella spiritensis TaxID=452 RepID=UPI000F6BF7AE|nr:hypothetical protein [Legionella spiritensis]VEG91690.1 Uncharacterised protein [Legionella spiritensis]